MQTHEKYMKLAIEMAKMGAGFVSPNPLVGAVIVSNNEIVAKNYHAKFGDLHAEVKALSQAGCRAKGSTLYVNLEPCCHHGKTPPCTQQIINSGISHVVIGTTDPNTMVNGKGIEQLKSHGINITIGILEEGAKKLNEFFFKYITTKKPFVILKAAMSIDGKIATKTGDSKWITNDKSRKFVHEIRNRIDAIMVGSGTILRDNPSLTTRTKQKKSKDPKRVIIDNMLKIPSGALIFTQDSMAENIIVTSKNAPPSRIKQLEDVGAHVIMVNTIKKNMLDLDDMLVKLGKLSITSIMIEGGHGLFTTAILGKIVDKIIIFIAPKIIGGKMALGLVGGEGISDINDAIKLHDVEIKRFSDDLMIEGYL